MRANTTRPLGAAEDNYGGCNVELGAGGNADERAMGVAGNAVTLGAALGSPWHANQARSTALRAARTRARPKGGTQGGNCGFANGMGGINIGMGCMRPGMGGS